MTFITLSYFDLVLASVLLFICGGLSMALKLGLERQIAVAAIRTLVQLLLIGFILKALFAAVSPWLTALAALVMALAAGREVVARQKRRFSGLWTYGIGTTNLIFAGSVVTIFALTALIQADPWHTPRYSLPLLGMILGNTMTGIAVGLDRLVSAAASERSAIESRLALGHDRTRVFRPLVRDALRAGLIHIINAMAAAGLISLPGMMTGQILAGVEPVEAVKYQVMIMFLIAGATGIGTLGAVLAGAWRLTDDRHRLRLDHLQGASR